jgi:hypothetical protein
MKRIFVICTIFTIFAGASNAQSINDIRIEHEYKLARAEALGKSGKSFNIPMNGSIADLQVKQAYDIARAKTRGANGLSYDGPAPTYPAAMEIENTWKMARARSRGASGLLLN